MSDDPVAVLNLQEEPAAVAGTPGQQWLNSLLALAGGIAVASVCAAVLPRQYGGRMIAGPAAAVVLVVGAVLSLWYARASIRQNEKRRVGAILAGLTCSLGLLAWGLSFLLQEKIRQQQRTEALQQHDVYLQQMAADPEIALREHWAQPSDTLRATVFRESLQDPAIHFSAGQLQRIYDEAPALRDDLFAHPDCPPEFLSAHFQEAWARAQKLSYAMLRGIIRNPNTPVKLLEQVARSEQLPANAVQDAKHRLQEINAGPPPEKFAAFRRYERGAEGKFLGLTVHGRELRKTPNGELRPVDGVVAVRVPGVPDFEKTHRSDEVVLLPGQYSEVGETELKQLRLAEEFVLEHNLELLKQQAAKRPAP